MEKNPGQLKKGPHFQAGSAGPPRLEDLGIPQTTAHRYQAIASLPEPAFEAYLSETKAAGQELTSASVYRKARSQRQG
jgi:hypothetical protein